MTGSSASGIAGLLLLAFEAGAGDGRAAESFRQLRECAACHPAQAKTHPATSMAHAMELPGECAVLRAHPILTFTDGPYTYRIERKGDQSIYSVSDGDRSLTAPIGWAFGLGSAGQTYVYEKGGELYQSRVSYYRDIDGLDLTLGAQNAKPADIMQAAGQLMARDEKVLCFRCHSTNAVDGMKLTLDRLIPGVQCERCHGPADGHLAAMKSRDEKRARMKDLRGMSAEETSNFCGQCHRTWQEIAGAGTLGVVNVRFQPYRLTNSKCYNVDDSRIGCLGCHDPHQELDRMDSNYDLKCQSCHRGGNSVTRVCKVSQRNCVSCHMPKIEIPGSHHRFTDHEIRIVRVNERYPD